MNRSPADAVNWRQARWARRLGLRWALGLAVVSGCFCHSATAGQPYGGSEANISLAREVYQTLLGAWNDARIAPELRIVDDESGAKAHSTVDGAIELSAGAIAATVSGPTRYAADRLAFLLAHELVHHRADHLWSLRAAHFRGLRQGDGPGTSYRVPAGRTDAEAQVRAEAEAQADAEGLVYMALAGFDPHAVVNDSRFLVRWVERIDGIDCAEDRDRRPACDSARQRAEHLRAQLLDLANRAVVFDLGVQAYVAGDYDGAREMFATFGRWFPESVVYSNLGTAYLAEAYRIRDDLRQYGTALPVAQQLCYPLELAGESRLSQAVSIPRELTRGEQPDPQTESMQRQLSFVLGGAQAAFDDAVRLAPGDKRILSHQIATYIAVGKFSLAQGLLEDEYLAGKPPDARYHLLAGMIMAAHGRYEQALRSFEASMSLLRSQGATLDAQFDIMAAACNQSLVLSLLGRYDAARSLWDELTERADAEGASALFRLALSRLQGVPISAYRPADGPGRRPGLDAGVSIPSPGTSDRAHHLLLGTQRGVLVEDGRGEYVILDLRGRVLAQWQYVGASTERVENEADAYARLVGKYGIPDRHIRTAGGLFLAYDAMGTGFQLRGGYLARQFRYPRLEEVAGEH